MFKLNGKPISLTNGMVIEIPGKDAEGNAITEEIQLVLPLDAERMAELGITEEADPPRADDRYYWNGDISTPKNLAELQATAVAQIKQTANSMLAASDWKIVREAEGVKPCDQATKDFRAAVRIASNSAESAILAAKDVAALAALTFTWPEA